MQRANSRWWEQSLPVRERGLKPARSAPVQGRYASLPVRERGLKPFNGINIPKLPPSLPVRERGLKHHTRALPCPSSQSLPVRERGLKQAFVNVVAIYLHVAPRAGAWIEAPVPAPSAGPVLSLPVRERGLKQSGSSTTGTPVGSLPVRERGLKLLAGHLYYLRSRRSPCGSVD